jgi:hypothetical protein
MKSLRLTFFILAVQSLVTYEKSMLDSRVDYNATWFQEKDGQIKHNKVVKSNQKKFFR